MWLVPLCLATFDWGNSKAEGNHLNHLPYCWDTVSDTHSFKEEGFVMAHSFRNFSSYSVGLNAEIVRWNGCVEGSRLGHRGQKTEKEGESQRFIPSRSHPGGLPVIRPDCLLHSTHSTFSIVPTDPPTIQTQKAFTITERLDLLRNSAKIRIYLNLFSVTQNFFFNLFLSSSMIYIQESDSHICIHVYIWGCRQILHKFYLHLWPR